MKASFTGQIRDQLQRASVKDFAGITENIKIIAADPMGAGHAVVDESRPDGPHPRRHVCKGCAWIVRYRFHEIDASVPPDTLHVERLDWYLRG